MTFRAADLIHHAPSGEVWVLAVDEESGRVMPAGWPESIAEAKDCTLIKAATDAERISMLWEIAKIPDSDMRASWARRQLEAAQR